MKETFYFSHDYNAQSDEKILELRMNLGWEGYGIYWALIERLASNKGKLDLDKINSIAFDMRVDNTVITDLLHNYNLFTIDPEEGIFFNERLLTHFIKRDELTIKKSNAGKKGMAKRWEKHNTVITENNTVITDYNKGKENKGKENKINNNKTNNIEIITKKTTPQKQNLEYYIKKEINLEIFEKEYNADNQYIIKQLKEFYLYWTEKKPNGKKEKWEMEKTFDVSRRFNKWLANSSKWNKNNLSPKKGQGIRTI